MSIHPNTMSLPNRKILVSQDHHTLHLYVDRNNSINYVYKIHHHYHQFRCDLYPMFVLHWLLLVPSMKQSECYSIW